MSGFGILCPVAAATQVRGMARDHLVIVAALVLLFAFAGALIVRALVAPVRRQHEITVQRRAEMERLSLAAQRTSNSVVLTNAARRITWVNDRFTSIAGFTASEAMGRSPGELL